MGLQYYYAAVIVMTMYQFDSSPCAAREDSGCHEVFIPAFQSLVPDAEHTSRILLPLTSSSLRDSLFQTSISAIHSFSRLICSPYVSLPRTRIYKTKVCFSCLVGGRFIRHPYKRDQTLDFLRKVNQLVEWKTEHLISMLQNYWSGLT